MTSRKLDSLPEDLRDTYKYYCITEDISSLDMSKIILDDVNQKQIDNFLKELHHNQEFKKYNLHCINKILCYGASGTGKTFLAKCIAASEGYELLTVDIGNIIDSEHAYIELAKIFKLANKIGNAIIFLDECDAIARQRGSLNNSPNIRQLINGLFKLIDNLSSDCICFAATNLEEQLDLAFMRRFDLKLRFERPTVKVIDDAIRRFLNPNIEYIENADDDIKTALMWALRSYVNLSFAEIEIWVQRAEKDAILEDRTSITQMEVYQFMLHNLRVKLCNWEYGKYVYQKGL